MNEINNLLMTDIQCKHSVELLQKVITSIESYPTLYEFKYLEELYTLSKDKQEKINKEYKKLQKKVNNSNIYKIRTVLSNIEETLNTIYITKYNEVTKNKIDIINNNTIKELYNEEILELEKKLLKQKEELRKELNKLDQSLNFSLTFTKSNDIIIINEDINTTTNIKELFQKLPIDILINEIDLEDTNNKYYEDIFKDLSDESYKTLFLQKNDSNLIYLREQKYPIIRVIKKLKSYSKDEYNNLEKQAIKTANLIIKVSQLENLNQTIKAYNFNKLSNYITKSIHALNKVTNDNNQIITTTINNLIPTEKEIENLNNNEKILVLDILKEILSITKEEAQMQCRYETYGNFINEAVSNYQKVLLSTKFNINFSVEKLIDKINSNKKSNTTKNKSLIKKLTQKINKKNSN